MGTDTRTKLLEAMGARARSRREELGMSVNDVAVKMGRTYQCIYGMERAGIESLRVVLEWAEALTMEPITLAFGKETKMSKADLVRRLREELGS